MKASAEDGSLELNKTSLALKEIAGIDVYSDKSKGQVKDMVTVLDEVQKKWGSLREDEQLALSEAISGKHQASVFQALMSNFDQFRKLRGELSQDMHLGSMEAEKQFSVYREIYIGHRFNCR
jgi:TP901 family phage tail tape measure protein